MKTTNHFFLLAFLFLFSFNIGHATELKKDIAKHQPFLKHDSFSENLFVTALVTSLETNDFEYLDAFLADSVLVIFTNKDKSLTPIKVTKDSVKFAVAVVVNSFPNSIVKVYRSDIGDQKVYTLEFTGKDSGFLIHITLFIEGNKIRKTYFH